ncbi:MAG: sulfatase [Verrucomicrobiae bacterium]|nr:sulfatase [Verrucomicrobiae bacterium]
MKIPARYAIPILLIGAGIHAASAAPGSNVLLVVVDDLNAELSCYGNPVVKSPNIDQLAARGVRFDRAYCQYPLCNPSRISFLSGLRPETTGVYVLGTSPRQAMPDAIMLPQLFRKNGYFSAGAGKVYHSIKTSDRESWDFYQDGEGDDEQEKAAIRARYSGGDGSPRSHVLDGDGAKTRDGINARKIAALLDERAKSGEPFFLAIGFHKPHLPWTAPRRFFDMYPKGSVPEPESPTMRKVPSVALQTELAGFAQPESRTGAIAGYYACISFMDDNLGLVLDRLDSHKLWERTVVVLVGDNGFHLGDHGGLWAKHTVFENATRVPLIIAGAGVPRGKVMPQPVELLDLYPTLAELCGLPAPSGLEGKSLVPLMDSGGGLTPSRAFSMVYHYDLTSGTDILGRSVKTGAFRYTEWANGHHDRELYLMNQEPDECDNRAEDPDAIEERTQGERWLRELKVPKPGPANRPRGLLKEKKR